VVLGRPGGAAVLPVAGNLGRRQLAGRCHARARRVRAWWGQIFGDAGTVHLPEPSAVGRSRSVRRGGGCSVQVNAGPRRRSSVRTPTRPRSLGR
jgi:hypothetical protein